MEEDIIVVASLDINKNLLTIAQSAMKYDKIEIQFMNKYAPTVEYIIRMLRKAFGWLEYDRGTKEVTNTKCKWNVGGFCTHEINKGKNVRCVEAVRVSCPAYERRDGSRFTANYVIIEKVGAIRGL